MTLWKDIGLIGRDRLLEKEVIPITLHPNKRFVLLGEAGIGKTAILECASENARRKSALVNAGMQNLPMLKHIAEAWEIEVESEGAKPKAAEYQTAILQCSGHALFIDDLHKAAPAKLTLFRALAERHKVCGAMRSGLAKKDDLKQFLWGVRQIKVERLNNAATERLTRELVLKEGSLLEVKQVSGVSGGVPGRIVAMVNSGQIQRHDSRLRSEEIDIGPWLIGLFGFMAIFRIMGRQMDATDLTLLGGAIMLIVRLFIYPFVSSGKQK
ncbi:MAG: ATP-binding protein [Desulfococcaceae bacterium]|jgi:hypothetical protein|nr:ATP-binding protein [Desulfococcaceae bacterium]